MGNVLCSVLLVILAGLTSRQVRVYRNVQSLWEDTVAKNPSAWIAHDNLGVALEQAGRVQEAIGHYKEALRLKPDDADAHFNLGIALGRTGKIQEAIEHYRQVVRLKPDDTQALYNLGATLWQADRITEAVEYWQQALRIAPDYVEVHNSLGNALIRLNRLPEAVEHFERALQIKPDDSKVQNNLAWLLATLAPAEGGNPARAVTLAQRVCGQTGNRVAAYIDTLAVAYASVGRFNDAIVTARKAIELARLAGQPQLVREIEPRLELYRDGRAYRPFIVATPPPNP